MGLYSVIEHFAEKFPDKLAILTEEDGTRTYAELALRARRLAVGFTELGYEPGTRVSLWMPNYPEYIDACLALDAAGLSAVAVNPQWTENEFRYILEHSGSRAVITDTANFV